MSVIYLKHERHGTKVAMSEQEASLDEANGWKKFDVNAFVSKEAVKAVTQKEDEPKEPPSERDIATQQYVVKFGKKPHWKMTVDQIQEELCQQP